MWLRCRQLRRQKYFLQKSLNKPLPSIIKNIEEGSNDFEDQVQQNNNNHRSIKIRCPGVRSGDIAVCKKANGASVSITLQNEDGLGDVAAPTVWKKTFQFPSEEGMFELSEDKIVLTHGILTLVFVVSPAEKHVMPLMSSCSDPLPCEYYDIAGASGYSESPRSTSDCRRLSNFSENSGCESWSRIGENLGDMNIVASDQT